MFTKPRVDAMNEYVWLAALLLCLLVLPGSLIALLFRRLRRKAKWAAAASAVGLVASFISFGVSSEMRDELDRSARDNGFLSAADQRAAEQAGVTDAAFWRQRREQADAAKAAEAEAARRARAAEAEARRQNREAEAAKAERTQRANEEIEADKVAKAEAALRANQQAEADEAEKAGRAKEQVDAAKAAEPAERQKGAAAMPCVIRGGKKECPPAKASP
jgi:hypothetical protein